MPNKKQLKELPLLADGVVGDYKFIGGHKSNLLADDGAADAVQIVKSVLAATTPDTTVKQAITKDSLVDLKNFTVATGPVTQATFEAALRAGGAAVLNGGYVALVRVTGAVGESVSVRNANDITLSYTISAVAATATVLSNSFIVAFYENDVLKKLNVVNHANLNLDLIALDAKIDATASSTTKDAVPTDGSTNAVESNGVFDALATKQDTLVSATNIKTINGASVLGSGDLVITPSGVVDAVPTNGSSNPVESNGVFDALATKQDVLTIDATPTDGSTNPVTSNGVFDALATKQNTLTIDAVPTNGSSNPVESNGVFDALATKQDVLTIDATPTDGSTNPVTSNGVFDALATKQDVLTIDATPTDGSTNPVTSNGVFDALATKQNTLTIDAVPTNGSSNPVESNGVFDALATKQDVLTIDTTPTDGSTNPVTSNGVFDALATKQDVLTIDAVPTNGSANPVQSDGVFDALAGKQDTLVSGTNVKTINGASVLGSGDLVITPSGVVDAVPTNGSSNPVESNGVFDALATKQDVLTIDATPTDGSTNPVTSNGVFDALATKQNTLTIDAVPTNGSSNPVESNGVFDALATKQDVLTIDAVPTDASNNPVASNGVFDELAKKVNLSDYGSKGVILVASAAGVTGSIVSTTDGQVPRVNTAQPTGMEFYTPLSLGRVQSNGADIKYFVMSGNPVVSFAKAGGIGTVTVTGGTVDFRSIQVDLVTSADSDGSGLFQLVVNGLQPSTMLEYPFAQFIDTKGGALPSTTAHVFRNNGSAPVISFSGGTAGSSITVKSVSSIIAIGTTTTLIVKF